MLVSGKVTFNGSPLVKGQIRFLPIEGSTGPVTVESITDGYYTSEDIGGVPVGVHRVEIRGYDPEVYAKAQKGPAPRQSRSCSPKNTTTNPNSKRRWNQESLRRRWISTSRRRMSWERFSRRSTLLHLLTSYPLRQYRLPLAW